MARTVVVTVWYEIFATRDRVRNPELSHAVGDRFYLGKDEWGPTLGNPKYSTPYRWTEVPPKLASWSGCPWYDTFHPSSLEIFKITERVSTTRERML